MVSNLASIVNTPSFSKLDYWTAAGAGVAGEAVSNSSSYWSSGGIGQYYDFFPKELVSDGGYSLWADKWSANLTNAGITGILTGFSALAGSFSGRNVYKYFKQQEDLYVQQGLEQARRLQLKGDIALRNLEVAHAIKQGKNELAVSAGAGGRLSGSFLDALSQNNKYNNMDERTQAIETLWEVNNARAQGYFNAARVAGEAMTYSYSQRNSALQGLTGMIKAASSDLLSDLNTYRQEENIANKETVRRQAANAASRMIYGNEFEQLGDLGSWSDPENSSVGSMRDSQSLLRIRY